MNKSALRKQWLELRNNLTASEILRLSSEITSRFLSSSCFQENSSFLFYLNIGNEVVTKDIIEHALRAGKKVFLPAPDMIDGKHLVAQFQSWDSLVTGAYGISFPNGQLHELSETDIAIVVMPGIVFDTLGNRIGFGKGFYDQLLSGHERKKVALAYDFQVFEGTLPAEKHDIRTETLFTETRTIICNTF